jgi:hypothetical protein
MQLETLHIEDWQSFIEDNDIDLLCKECGGEGCEECTDGFIEPMCNWAYDTEFYAVDMELPRHLPNVVVFRHDDKVFFALTSCGQDNRPHLAAAWMQCFPDAQWLPGQFILDGCNLRNGYYETELGKEIAEKIYKLIEQTIKGRRFQLDNLERDLTEARKCNHLNNSSTPR